jgi:RecA/RadA recombinase
MTERRQLKSDQSGGGQYGFKPDEDVNFFSSGCRTLDLELGGGWAEQRPSNIIGDSSTGKTLLAVEAGVNFIRKYPKGHVRYREREAAFSRFYIANKLGMPLTGFDISDNEHPSATIEDLYEELEYRVEKAKSPELMVVDSLDAYSTRKELARAIDKQAYATEKAKQLSALFRRINWAMSEKHITLMIVSQVRANISGFGREWERSGGRALQFYCSQVVVLKPAWPNGKIVRAHKEIKRVIGINVQAYIDKNKVGAAYGTAEFPIIFGYGIDDALACRKYLRTMKVISEKDKTKRSLQQLHQMVEKTWVQFDQVFSPKTKKYA